MKNKKKNVLARYNGASAKKNMKVTALKTGVGVLSASSGAGMAALIGNFSPIAGLVLIGLGNFLGDKSGLLSIAGAATIGYGLAKAGENRTSENTVKDRMVNFKNDWLKATYLDKVFNKGETKEDGVEIGSVDSSVLDQFQQRIKESAVKFQMSQMADSPSSDDFDTDDEEEIEEAEFTILPDGEVDFSDF
jgi:hypothetical protein